MISFATRKVVATWHLPGGGSPDMGGISADGRVLWLAGRYHAEVYALDTSTGALLARIKVGQGPTVFASTPSRAATHSATPACSADGPTQRTFQAAATVAATRGDLGPGAR